MKNEPRKIEKKGSIGGLSINRPVPIIKIYKIPATVSQTPLKMKVMAKGFNLLLFMEMDLMN